MSRLTLAGAAAILVVLGGIIALSPRRAPDVTSTPSPSPSASAGASGDVVLGPLDDTLRATWIGIATEHPKLRNGSGPVSMSVSPLGTAIDAANFGPGHGYASTATGLDRDRIEVRLGRAGGECAAGARGVYRWGLSADKAVLTLNVLSEECATRGLVFGRRWGRSLVGETTVGSGFVDAMDPGFRITLPDNAYQSRTLTDFFEIAEPNGFSLMAFKNPQPFVDACSDSEERVPYRPGAAAFIEAFRNNDAFEVGPSTALKIDGHDAMHVVIGGKPDYARCPGRDLYQYTPKDCLCHFIVGQGAADSMYLVGVGSDTYMFIVSPLDSADEDAVIDSIRIPVTLPTQ